MIEYDHHENDNGELLHNIVTCCLICCSQKKGIKNRKESRGARCTHRLNRYRQRTRHVPDRLDYR